MDSINILSLFDGSIRRTGLVYEDIEYTNLTLHPLTIEFECCRDYSYSGFRNETVALEMAMLHHKILQLPAVATINLCWSFSDHIIGGVYIIVELKVEFNLKIN